MVPSTKLITIREAAKRLGLKESTIRKYILKRQIAYVKPSFELCGFLSRNWNGFWLLA
jgi:phage antirepressor YoqD-like protein